MHTDELAKTRDLRIATRLGKQLAKDDCTWMEAQHLIMDAFDDDLLRAAARMSFNAASSWRVYG